MTIHLYKNDDGKLIQIWYDPHVRSWFGQQCHTNLSVKGCSSFLRDCSMKGLRLFAKDGNFKTDHFWLREDLRAAEVKYRRETVEHCFKLNRKAHYIGKLNNKSVSEVYA